MSHSLQPNSQSLPYHLSEGSFRRFEKLIASAVESWPASTKFTTTPESGMSTSVFVARLRDAITSFRRYGWKTEIINVEKFKEIGSAAVVRHDSVNDCAWFTQRKAAGRAPAGLSVPSSSIPTANKPGPSGQLRDLTNEEFNALCLLASNGRISTPIIVFGEVDQGWIASASFLYDIGVTFDPSSNSTIIL